MDTLRLSDIAIPYVLPRSCLACARGGAVVLPLAHAAATLLADLPFPGGGELTFTCLPRIPAPRSTVRAVRTPGQMAPSGKQVGQLGLVAAAFLAGRWTHSSGAGSPPQAALSDVAPEERHLLYTPPAGHGAVEVSLTLTRSLTVARNPIPKP